MSQALIEAVVIALVAGLAMPAGALLARVKGFQPDWLEEELRHSILALGAGALISAVALVLVPESLPDISGWMACLCFFAGALAFMGLDIYLARQRSQASQLAAMLSDFIPESIALGTTAALGGSTLLLGVLIAVQNLPEGFNAYRELEASKRDAKRVKPSLKLVFIFTLMALLGPLATLVGYHWLSVYPAWVAGIMLFAAGGILYSVFQDIAPNIRMEKHWAPPLGAVIGFLIGMLGLILVD